MVGSGQMNQKQSEVSLYGRCLFDTPWEDQGTAKLWISAAADWVQIGTWVSEQVGMEPRLGMENDQSVMFWEIEGDSFVNLVSDWAGQPKSELALSLSPELDLYVRGARLATVAIAARDVLAFAAGSGQEWLRVFMHCLDLADATNPDWEAWGGGQGTFVAAWIPAWSKEDLRVLRAVLGSVAQQVWPVNVGTAGQENQAKCAGLAMERWLWRCIDWHARQLLGPAGPAESARLSASPFRVRYRGEEETVHHWQSALAVKNTSEQRAFAADGWLLWRMIHETFQSSGWRKNLLCDRSGNGHYHLEFDLCPPGVQQKEDSGQLDWQLRFYVAHNVWSVRARLSEWWQQPGRTWRVGREWLVEPDSWFLPALQQAGQVAPEIAHSLQHKAPSAAQIGAQEVVHFLTETVPELLGQGFVVKFQDLQNVSLQDIRIRVRVGKTRRKVTLPSRNGVGERTGEGFFETNQLVEFDWTVAIAGKEISREEFENMVRQRTPFLELEGTWKLVPLEHLWEALQPLRQGNRGTTANLLSLTRSLLQVEAGMLGGAALEVELAPVAQGLREAWEGLLSHQQPPQVAIPLEFRGSLRSYQAEGLAWLVHLRRMGLGGVLADDMGLGKTVQVLAYLQYLKQQCLAQGPHLLLCPTSLVTNWRAEAGRFTPALKLYIHHGADRNNLDDNGLLPLDRELTKGCDVVLTTYATAVRDLDQLTAKAWDVVTIDEAQAIKNPDTKQAQAVLRLHSHHRLALTGTPVENRLEELWSILQFTTPEYLGSLAWFRHHFVEPIVSRGETRVAKQLHQVLQPVLLRRTKMDPDIRLELPDKWEVVEYAGLTTEQAALYQAVINRLFAGLNETVGPMSRRGRILTTLVRLKQVCDHPCLTSGGSADAGRSAKLRRLLDLLEEVVEEGEAALVFTQFRGMGEVVCSALERRFGWRPDFLHGGLSTGQRARMIEDFQTHVNSPPVLVLSLKAGGLGLNLTRANHVFHFDRWWNPAVEDQATDRAFRIGQVRDVQVHKFVCTGTLEERIDDLIRSKRALSATVVGQSEGWITEMDNESLRDLFSLDLPAALEEED
ncbi:DEAD/DEAH box helicase [Alicyclobacillaceae bacterium I2511]|nr:DEAD/DEAH box helicase [Alicyclobacillaceae bacterium I2511]